MEREVRRLLFLEANDPLPDGIHLSYVAPDLAHQTPPASEIPLFPTRKENEENKYQHVLDAAWKEKVDHWQKLIQRHTRREMCNLALIEMVKQDRDEWLKQAIRRACVNAGVLSQMLISIPPEIDSNPDWHKQPKLRGEIGRIRNAVRDLLLRHTNVLYGALPDLYCYAGLTPEIAENLMVIGMYRHKANYPNPVDFPMAVELHPDGRVMVIIPDADGNPQPPLLYTEAAAQIGSLFAGSDKTRYQFKNPQLATFAQAILARSQQTNRLMLWEADGWRSGILPLNNEAMLKILTENDEQLSYELNVSGNSYTPEILEGVRMLRVRDQGTLKETPQYAAANIGSTWDNWTEFGDPATMIGVIDASVASPFFHFFSIGKQLQAVKEDNEEENQLYSYGEGGDVAFKHQQAVEMVPFFLQAGDDPLVYCRIAHFLRTSPAWRGGNTVLPYPIHLASTLCNDLKDVFVPRI